MVSSMVSEPRGHGFKTFFFHQSLPFQNWMVSKHSWRNWTNNEQKKTINEKLLRVVDSQFLIQSNGFQTRLNLMKVNNF